MSDTINDDRVADAGAAPTELQRQILAFIQKEIQDKSAVLTLDTRHDDVVIDSIDIVNVVFSIEEKYDVEVNLSPESRFETVGELVDALIAFIPESKRSPK